MLHNRKRRKKDDQTTFKWGRQGSAEGIAEDGGFSRKLSCEERVVQRGEISGRRRPTKMRGWEKATGDAWKSIKNGIRGRTVGG